MRGLIKGLCLIPGDMRCEIVLTLYSSSLLSIFNIRNFNIYNKRELLGIF